LGKISKMQIAMVLYSKSLYKRLFSSLWNFYLLLSACPVPSLTLIYFIYSFHHLF